MVDRALVTVQPTTAGAVDVQPPPTFTMRIASLDRLIAAPAALSLLKAALNAGLRLPSSCRVGTCRACRCRMTAGQVGYVVEWPGLLEEEHAQGWILPCVAVPLSDVTIDPDEVIDVTTLAPSKRPSRGF